MLFNDFAKQAAIAAVCFGVVSSAQALTFEPFTEARFKALQAENKPILVDISAKWCPTCRKQHEILTSYQKANPSSGITVLNVDFDDQKQWVTHFKAPRQSTFAFFKGSKQIGFSVAETRTNVIFQQLDTLRSINSSSTTPAVSQIPSNTEDQPKQGFFQRLFQRS